MAYADYEFYKTIYGDTMPETDFNRLEWDARRKVDNLTFGKLKFAFPTDEDDIEAVRRCVCELISVAWQIESKSKSLSELQGYEQDETGAMRGKIVSSKTSGSESISYTAKVEGGTVIDSVLSNKSMQDKLYADIVRGYLGCIADSNGVSLLYAGIPYPFPNAPISKPPQLPPKPVEPEPPTELEPEIPAEPPTEPEVSENEGL